MRWITGLRVRIRQLVSRSAAEERMEEEIRLHIEMQTEANLRAGMAPAEARRRAVLSFGGAETHKEAMRAGRRVPLLEDLWRDGRYAGRALRRTPVFLFTAVLTLALGIAATTVMFALVDGVLLRPLPVDEPERLATLRFERGNGEVVSAASHQEYVAYRDLAGPAFSGVAAHHLADVTISTDGGAEVALGMMVSGNYFGVLGVRAALGSFFASARMDQPTAEPVAVISHDVWQTRFGGTPDAVGRSIGVNGRVLTIVGVAPRGFHGAMIGVRPAVWVPIGLARTLSGRDPADPGWSWLQLFGRLNPGVSREQAVGAMTIATRRIAESGEYDRGREPVAAHVSGFSALPPRLRAGAAGFMALLFASGSLVLLIGIVNVAGMLMARGSTRRREMGIRLALGAGRRRLIRQLLTESLLLAALGCAAGVVLSIWASRYFTTIRLPVAGAIQLDLPLDARVLSFAVGVSLISAVLFGLTPSLFTVRRDLVPALKEGSPGAGRRSRLRAGMVAGQLALSVLLLVVAGLFFRTLQTALATDHGFDPDGVMVLEMDLALNRYDASRGRVFYEQLLERARAVPGVESAALAGGIPLSGSWDQTRARIPGYAPPQGEPGFVVGLNIVSDSYFETLRMPLLAGRAFTPSDANGAPPPIVINQTFARRFWPERSPVGEMIWINGGDAEVIGVVPDGKYRALVEETPLFAYAPLGPAYSPAIWLHVRTRGNQTRVMAAIRREIAELDPRVPPIAVTTMRSVLGSLLFPQRLASRLVATFGAIGLFLAAIGIFGLLSISVAERTREIALRTALGASRAQVRRLILGEGLWLLAVGIGLGLVAALGVSHLLRGLLYGLSPRDPVTFIAVPLLLAVVALFAAYLPARRATRLDPVVALRGD